MLMTKVCLIFREYMISFNLDFSSEKCALVCSNFGISSRHRNIFNLNDLDPNNLGFDINNGITLITGHSGVGKSTIGEVLRNGIVSLISKIL